MVFCRRSRQGAINLADRINDIAVDPLGVFRADADLDETVEGIQRLPATVWALFDFLSFRAVKRRPVRMPGSFVDHGFLDGQQNRPRQRGCRDFSLP